MQSFAAISWQGEVDKKQFVDTKTERKCLSASQKCINGCDYSCNIWSAVLFFLLAATLDYKTGEKGPESQHCQNSQIMYSLKNFSQKRREKNKKENNKTKLKTDKGKGHLFKRQKKEATFFFLFCAKHSW